jgi:hypothetical protein
MWSEDEAANAMSRTRDAEWTLSDAWRIEHGTEIRGRA